MWAATMHPTPRTGVEMLPLGASWRRVGLLDWWRRRGSGGGPPGGGGEGGHVLPLHTRTRLERKEAADAVGGGGGLGVLASPTRPAAVQTRREARQAPPTDGRLAARPSLHELAGAGSTRKLPRNPARSPHGCANRRAARH